MFFPVAATTAIVVSDTQSATLPDTNAATVVSDTQSAILPDTNAAVASSVSGYTSAPNFNNTLLVADSQISLTTLLTRGTGIGIGSTQLQLNAFFSPEHFKFIFGQNAVQNINSLIIQKRDIPQLTPAVNNSAESLLIGLLSIALSGKNVVELPEITFKYWGYGKSGDKRIDTVLIDIRNQLILTNTYEIPETTTVINPNDY
ncbi:hypothetical protein [Nostoc sp.]|uniref:hypothetical protein n=1 Tax=Nostoc sp. TaxID=1180 RepID=UPI002FFAE430